ncbi:MAG: type II toxin-antitoxin system HicA family toxin, partial [bacterium]
GWYLVRTRGSHRQYQHQQKLGTVTIPGQGNKDIHPRTLASILRQAQIE